MGGESVDRPRHRRVDAARQGADDVRGGSNLLLDDGDLFVEDVLHGPTRRDARDVKQKVTKRLLPALRVRHLWVVLQPVDVTFGILDGLPRRAARIRIDRIRYIRSKGT